MPACTAQAQTAFQTPSFSFGHCSSQNGKTFISVLLRKCSIAWALLSCVSAQASYSFYSENYPSK